MSPCSVWYTEINRGTTAILKLVDRMNIPTRSRINRLINRCPRYLWFLNQFGELAAKIVWLQRVALAV